jgi:hypothetical protein
MSKWKIDGYDTFSREPYALGGEHESQAAAESAAWKRLKELELRQPTAMSGGQSGIQDRIYIIRADGTQYLYEPPASIPG